MARSGRVCGSQPAPGSRRADSLPPGHRVSTDCHAHPAGPENTGLRPGGPAAAPSAPRGLLHGARPRSRGGAASTRSRGEAPARPAPSALTSGAGAPGSCPGGRRGGPGARPARAGQAAGPAAASRTPGPLPAPPWRPTASASGARELY